MRCCVRKMITSGAATKEFQGIRFSPINTHHRMPTLKCTYKHMMVDYEASQAWASLEVRMAMPKEARRQRVHRSTDGHVYR
jgi:hypothetical protein